MLKITYYSLKRSGVKSPAYLLLFILLFVANFSFLHAAAPPNDACSAATPLPCGTNNLAGTTKQSVSETAPSGCSSEYGVWYKFTGDGQQTTISSTADFDHELTLVSGSCGSFTDIACVDGTTTSWTYTFTTTNGVQYYIYVAHYSTSSNTRDNFKISRTCSPAPTPPVNDVCANATALPCGTTNLAGTTVNSVSETTIPATDNTSKFGVWYTFVGNNQNTTITSVAGSGYDHEMVIMSGNSCGSFIQIANLDGSGSGGTETYTFTPTNGVQYYIYVADYLTSSSTTGTFTMSRSCVAPCSGTPTGGTTLLSPNSGNPSSAVNGSVTGATTGSGLTYQWQFSDNGSAPWTDIVGQTAETLSTTAKSTLGTRYYRRAITCAGTTSYSMSVIYTTQITYCTPVSTYGDLITGFSTSGGVTNITNTGNGGNNGGYTDFYNVHVVSQYPGSNINFTETYTGGNHGFSIWIDVNANGTFETSERVYNAPSTANGHTGSFTIPLSATPGNYRMRIRGWFGSLSPDPCTSITYGEAEDYKVTILSLANCTGTPTGGATVLSPSSGNISSAVNGSVTGSTTASGITYQWQYSDNGTLWTNITGQTSATLTTTAISTLGTRQYRRAIICAGTTSYSTPATYTTQLVYCTPVSTSSDLITGFSTSGGITNITNTANGGNNGGYTDFYNAHTVSQYAGSNISFTETYSGGSHGFSIWIDVNANGTFETSERVYNAPSTANGHTGSFTIPLSATPGNYRMRIRGWYGSLSPDPCTSITYGEAEDYKVTVFSLANCTGTPSAGTPTVSSLSTCPNIIFNLSVTGNSSINASGLSGIWQSSPQGLNTWTDVTGSQNQPNYMVVTGITASTDYRYVVNCSFSSQTVYSSIISVIIDCTSNSPGCPDVNINPGSLAINGNSLVIPCGDNTADLTAEYLKTGGTQSYRVESIPYNPPFPFTGGSGSTSITDDDEWSEIIDLGFDFCFYGNTFNKALFGSNGAITFDIDGVIPGGRYSPNTGSGYLFNSTIPSSSSGGALPYVNSIMGVLQDTDPAAYYNYPDWSINYQIMGIAPCRMLVVNMYNLALYDCEDSEGPQTYQMVIYETTNAIDVYVKDRTSCTGFNDGSGLIGLQNADGSLGIAPPGRNTGTWSAHNEAWRFIPDGTPNYTFGWYDASNVLISTADQLTVGPGTYTSRIVYHTCYGVDITKEQTLIVTKETEIDLNAIVDLEKCEETAGTAYFDLTQNSSNALGTNSPSDYTISYYDTQANAIAGGVTGKITTPTNYQNTANPQSIWLRIHRNANTNCYDVTDFKLIVKPTPTPTFVSVVPSTNVCYGTNVTYTTQSGMTNYTWTIPGTAGSNYTLISGGTSTSNTAVIAWNSDVNGTLIQVGYTENGCAAITPASSIQVTLPTKGTTLGNNSDNATCVVYQNSYVHFYHSTGRLLASVNSNGQNLGNVTVTSYVEPSHLNVPACLDPTNPNYITATMKRHWVITPEFQPASPVTVRLPFDNAEFTTLQTLANGNINVNDNLVTIANLKLSKYKGPLNVNNLFADNCTNAGGSGGTQLFDQAANGNVTAYQTGFSASARYTDFSIPNFSEFWLHGSTSSPLPVTLTDFSVSCESNATINWSTASEQNSDRFIIEKSRDGQDWISVGEKAAAGNSNTLIIYSIVDENSWNGVTYYRMIQIDINGKQEVYGPISADCGSDNNSMIVYPNPNNGTFTVEISASENISDGQIQLFDLTGKLILNQVTPIAKGINQVYFNNVDLHMGSYLVKFLGGNNTLKPIKIVIK